MICQPRIERRPSNKPCPYCGHKKSDGPERPYLSDGADVLYCLSGHFFEMGQTIDDWQGTPWFEVAAVNNQDQVTLRLLS